MFDVERVSFTERMQEVRALHQAISELESPDPMQPDTSRVLILRGLFYVLLYGGFEFAVNRLVSATLREVSGVAEDIFRLEPAVFSLALNPQLQALEEGANKAKWARRVSIFEAQAAAKPCAIEDSVLSLYLQNIGREALEQVFRCFGIKAPVVPSPRHYGFLDELLEKRRAVSHGRTSAEEAGRAYRGSELVLRLDAVIDVVAHLELTFADYITNRMYLSANHR